ncbi:MAG: M48 family metalloprotease, partial [Polyangiaceae bacterium]
AELIANLSPQNQAKVRGIPLVIDPDPNEVNAFAGCDEQGAPFLAGTEGLLEAVDAISQTRATDELFGTQTYEAYSNVTMPKLLQPKGSPALTPGIIPAQYLNNPQRLSRAHEIFDDIVAFTFGHELGHHYLNHTGCANGQAMTGGPSLATLNQIATRIAPGLNQANEWAADNAGCINVLGAGAARRPKYRWSEKGGLQLMDFFSRLERASGISVFNPIGFLRTHPNPQLRIPPVQIAARTWYFQHPSVNPNLT